MVREHITFDNIQLSPGLVLKGDSDMAPTAPVTLQSIAKSDLGSGLVASARLQSIASGNSHARSLPPIGLQSIAKSMVRPLEVDDFVRASIAPNTRRAYQSDVNEFHRWGGTVPSTPEAIARYLADMSLIRSPFTLARRLVALSRAHLAMGFSNPCSAEIVRTTMRGIRRIRGTNQRRVDPLLRDDLLKLLDFVPSTTMAGLRDRALLLVGFAGAFRRSEIAAMEHRDLCFVQEGVLISLSRSKTDQEGQGRQVAIPKSQGPACPVRALRAWIAHAELGAGPVFRSVDRRDCVLHSAIRAASIALLIKRYAAAVGFDPSKFSGHSLRAGLVTSAAKVGVSSWKIRQQTGHKSDAMVQRYIRDADLFNGNAAGLVL